MPDEKPTRCAIYTRKSSEEGLEQDFNSLDAQREACEAFIRSQRSEGWTLVANPYDDGGYSGGTLTRPGLERLLADIAAGVVDTVVVYKVDRLTRSLADFSKIVEVLDVHDASFVSVTQQFNTTTSMGRLTLNMLLSFAQFEREVTGERIRDKIAASKRKGLWMGGPVPLGYEPDGRTLAIVESEAETVRTLFTLYLELGSVRRVQEEARRRGLISKVRQCAAGRMRGGRPIGRGYLYHLLASPIYVGRIPHNGESYVGQHPAIIDRQTWEAVQGQLRANACHRGRTEPKRESSPLRGRLFDNAGVPLTPSHTVKSGRRYRYYVSRNTESNEDAPAAKGGRPRWRLPAREIEGIVGHAVGALLKDPVELARLAHEARVHDAHVSSLIEGARDCWREPLELVRRVELRAGEIALDLDFSSLLGEALPIVRAVLPVHIQRRGIEMRLVLESEKQGKGPGRMDPSLVKAIVRGQRWFDQLTRGRAESMSEIAKDEGVTPHYVSRLISLAFLAPDIVEAIFSGTQPVELTVEALTKHGDLPLDWAEQRPLLGLDERAG